MTGTEPRKENGMFCGDMNSETIIEKKESNRRNNRTRALGKMGARSRGRQKEGTARLVAMSETPSKTLSQLSKGEEEKKISGLQAPTFEGYFLTSRRGERGKIARV